MEERSDSGGESSGVGGGSSVAVIVGAGGQLGGASAIALARRGVACVLAGPREETLMPTLRAIRELGGEAIAVVGDASEEADVRGVFETCRQRFGPCDVLVHAAAIQGPTAPLPEISLTEWEHVLRVNLGSVFLCAREALSDMAGRGHGTIVFTSSADALRGFPMTGPYAASKSALTGLARALAAEAAASGVRVNVLSPGPIPAAAIFKTAIGGIAARMGVAPERLLGEVTGAERGYSAAEIAQGVVFLATSDSGPMTGQSLVMDSMLTQV